MAEFEQDLSVVTYEDLKRREAELPDQLEQLRVARDLFSAMGIGFMAFDLSIDPRTGKDRSREVVDILPPIVGFARRFPHSPYGALRHYGVDGSERPLGFSVVTWAGGRVERVPGVVAEAAARQEATDEYVRTATEKRSSAANTSADLIDIERWRYLDGAEVAKILVAARKEGGLGYLIKQDDETGIVQLWLYKDSWEEGSQEIGGEKVVGLEYRPSVAKLRRDKRPKVIELSETVHGEIAFLCLPDEVSLEG